MMLASLRLDSSRRRKLCFFSSTFKLLWVDGYQAFSEKLGFGNFVGSLVEPFGAEGNRFMTKTVLSNTTPRGMEALYIVARRCSTMCRCWRSARPFCSGVGGHDFWWRIAGKVRFTLFLLLEFLSELARPSAWAMAIRLKYSCARICRFLNDV